MSIKHNPTNEEFELFYKKMVPSVQEFPLIYFHRTEHGYSEDMIEAAYQCWKKGHESGYHDGYNKAAQAAVSIQLGKLCTN